MTMLPVNNGDWVAEVIESSTTEFTAECRELNGSPPFGALVRVRSSPWWIYGVVHHISTQSIEPYRRPMAFGKTEEELRQEQPQIYALLRTHFKALVVGYASEEQPSLIVQAHRRQPGRFSTDILFHAVQNTASNMWQAFYFDFDEHDRAIPRTTTPLTGVLNVLHGPQPIPNTSPRPRISDLAMAFFAFQIIRAVEHLAHQRGIHDEALFEHHYRHLATLVQRSGYRFPNDRRQAEALALEVDAQLAKGDPECVACWRNLLRVAQRLGIPLSEGQLASFLLPHERRYFEAAMLARSSSPAPLALQCAAEDG